MTKLPDLLPARILNEHIYCPRLAYLEWVDSGFTDNADTVEGTLVHQRVDNSGGPGAGAQTSWTARARIRLPRLH